MSYKNPFWERPYFTNVTSCYFCNFIKDTPESFLKNNKHISILIIVASYSDLETTTAGRYKFRATRKTLDQAIKYILR